MTGPWFLTWRYLLHHRGRTATLIACIALAVFLPAAIAALVEGYRGALTARAAASPMLLGSHGSRFDLTLAALYFRPAAIDPVRVADLRALEARGGGLAIPLHTTHTARGVPLIGTTPEYFEHRGLRPAVGTLPLQLGDVVLGHGAAGVLGLGPGAALFSDQRELYDISVPPALKMRVTGVLAPTGTADDGAAFVGVNTCWLIDGSLHGHGDAERDVDPSLVLHRTDEQVTLSQALIELNEVTDANVDSFHVHGDPDELPLTAILFVPRDAKAGSLAKSATNADRRLQMVVPAEVVDDLLAFVFRIKAFFDAVTAVLAVITAILSALVIALSTRLRAGELRTLHHLGCSRYTTVQLLAIEILAIVSASAVLAAAGVWLCSWWLPDWMRWL